jgi:glycosyltransferase involved in cell wall biosynthesis
MKVLIVGPNLYDRGIPCFSSYQNGLAAMISEETEHLANAETEVFFFSNVITKEIHAGSALVVKHTWLSFFSSIRFSDIAIAVGNLFRRGLSLHERIHGIYYGLNRGSFRRVLKAVRPDVVQFHGASLMALSLIGVCRKIGIPYVLTLHGIINKPEIACSQGLKNIEKLIANKTSKLGQYITCISSGTADFVINQYGCVKSRVRVVCNDSRISLVAPEPIPALMAEQRQLVCYVGNYTKNKNQEALLRAVCKLSPELRDQFLFVFPGNSGFDVDLKNLVSQLGLSDCVCLLGFLPQSQLAWLYSHAFGNVLLSFSEGFGLTLIESALFGCPSLVSDTIDSLRDFSTPQNSVIVSHDSSDELRGLTQFLSTEWDRKAIATGASKFLFPSAEENYRRVLQEVASNAKHSQ